MKNSTAKIAVYTLTRERLAYTKHCFETLRQKAGMDFDHYIVDNGSQDGTVDWLKEHESEFSEVVYLPENVGIYIAANKIRKKILRKNYSLVAKIDNDCEVVSDNLLAQMFQIFQELKHKRLASSYILSPRVEGLINQPKRKGTNTLAGHKFGSSRIVGGICRFIAADLYRQFDYPENLPMARGGDSKLAHWAERKRVTLGYIEDLRINHYETTKGQWKRFPEYFDRKINYEEKTPPKQA